MIFSSKIVLKILIFVFLIEKANTPNNNCENEIFELKQLEPAGKYYLNMISYYITRLVLNGELNMNRGSELDYILNNVIKRYPRNVENHFVKFMNLEWNEKHQAYKSKKFVGENCFWKFLPVLIYKLKNTVLKSIIDKYKITSDYFSKEIENTPQWKSLDRNDFIDNKIKKVREKLSLFIRNSGNNPNNSSSELIYDDKFCRNLNNREYLFENQFLTENAEMNSENLELLYSFELNEMYEKNLLNDLFSKFKQNFYFKNILVDVFQEIGISSYVFTYDLSRKKKRKLQNSIAYIYTHDKYFQECFIIYLSNSLKPHLEKYVKAMFRTIEEFNLTNIFLMENFE
ncbi:hypothetical protein CWI38_0852p0030 [Hamiltosporidium tvaerminnensis]|uniref:Uncharacterized protein n=1 Tax=Hamiltosporidium tvaerminnensis TaxID=1176355 RepID=A0A4Q9LVB3_9MICR|nr:hypothetical protein CWI38_0852p0030 [Hamiltosporidium tvaerminnensis]